MFNKTRENLYQEKLPNYEILQKQKLPTGAYKSSNVGRNGKYSSNSSCPYFLKLITSFGSVSLFRRSLNAKAIIVK